MTSVHVTSIATQYGMYAVYAVGLVIAFRIAKRPMRSLYDKGFAAIMNAFSKKYNIKMNSRKEALFSEMKKMSSELKRPLEVLEIGAGGGANFKYYPEGTRVLCVDPNPHFDQYLTNNSAEFPHVCLKEFIVGKAEDMSQLVNSSVDAVVCTLVLCGVDDVELCLREIKRVLRPGGKFFFLEHVAAEPGTLLRKVQGFVAPFWLYFLECHLTRQPWKHMEQAGFSSVNIERFATEKKSGFGAMLMAIMRPHCSGVITK